MAVRMCHFLSRVCLQQPTSLVQDLIMVMSWLPDTLIDCVVGKPNDVLVNTERCACCALATFHERQVLAVKAQADIRGIFTQTIQHILTTRPAVVTHGDVCFTAHWQVMARAP